MIAQHWVNDLDDIFSSNIRNEDIEQLLEKIIHALGKWKIVRLLSTGQFGKMYEIQHTDFRRVYRVVLKTISILAYVILK